MEKNGFFFEGDFFGTFPSTVQVTKQVKRVFSVKFIKGLGGFQRLKTGTFLLFFFYISNEIFYSNS